MVAPIKEVANKQFSLFSAISYYSTMSQFSSNIEIDAISNSIVKGRSNLSSKARSRSFSVFSSTSSISYYKYIEMDNNKPEEDIREPIDSSQLSYKDTTNKGESVSRVTVTSPADGKQCESNEALALKNVLNHKVGLVIVSNQLQTFDYHTMSIRLRFLGWQFPSISLHRSMEHLLFDIKNIKMSLN